MAKPKLLNVKKHLENIDYILTKVLCQELPPAHKEALREVLLINKNILRKHGERETRKDIRL